MRHDPTLSEIRTTRRTALAGLSAGALGLAILMQHLDAVVAQDATPGAAPSRANHPVIGAWQQQASNDSTAEITIAVFAVDGTFLEYRPSATEGIGIGEW